MTPKNSLVKNWLFFYLWDLEVWGITLKNNRTPLPCYLKLCASFVSHWWIKTAVTLPKRLSWDVTCLTFTFDLWPWPFAWTLHCSFVITHENFIIIRWWEHRHRVWQTDRRAENTIHRAAWLQLKITTWGMRGKSSGDQKRPPTTRELNMANLRDFMAPIGLVMLLKLHWNFCIFVAVWSTNEFHDQEKKYTIFCRLDEGVHYFKPIKLPTFCPVLASKCTYDLRKQYATCYMLLQALCIIS